MLDLYISQNIQITAKGGIQQKNKYLSNSNIFIHIQ